MKEIERDPAWDHFRRGMSLADAGDLEGAAGELRCGASLFLQAERTTQQVDVLVELGDVLQRQGAVGAAVRYTTKAKELHAAEEDPDARRGGVIDLTLSRYLLRLERPIEALRHAEEALIVFRALSLPSWCGSALLVAGEAQEVSSADFALEAYSEALEYFKTADEPDRIALALNLLGSLARSQGRLEDALRFHSEALDVAPDGSMEASAALSHQGLALGEMGRVADALESHTRAQELRGVAGDLAGVGSSLNNVALCLEDLGCEEAALAKLEEAVLVLEEGQGSPELLISTLRNAAGLNQKLGRTEAMLACDRLAELVRERMMR